MRKTLGRSARRAFECSGRILGAFRRDEEGGIIVLTLLLLVVMLVIGGMAVDFMRFESRRAILQSVSDRAVLAAAELDQELDPKDVVTDYFRAAGLESTLIGEPEIVSNGSTRSVSVRSQLGVNTFFLRLVGMEELEAPAAARAVEGTGAVEISLVLDVSGSMGNWVGQSNDTRINLLKSAANNFVDEVLQPKYQDQISVSLVTYSHEVNVGEGIYAALNTTPDSMAEDGTVFDSNNPGFPQGAHGQTVTNPSRCVDFNWDEFATTTFDTQRTYQQVERYQFVTGNRWITKPICPESPARGIIPLSQNATELKTAISELTPQTSTSIHLGMKWGVSLLDPSMRSLLAGVSDVDPAFTGYRPGDYNDQTTKYVVLMTDGENTSPRRLRNEYYWSGRWAYFWRTRLHEYPHYYWYNWVNDHPWGHRPTWSQLTYKVQPAWYQDVWLSRTCSAAKAQGITVFTIALGATTNGETQMRACASEPSDSHYFQTEGAALDDIFQQIARQITDLRLNL